MIRFFYLLLALPLGCLSVQAQPVAAARPPQRTTAEPPGGPVSPIYLKVYGYYGPLTPGSLLSSTYSNNATGGQTFKTTRFGLGAGARAGIGIGFIASDFINLGLDADWLFADKLKRENATSYNNFTYSNTITTNLQVASLVPNITFKALARPSYYIYNRLGIMVGAVLTYEQVINELNTGPKVSPTTGVYRWRFSKNSLALGYQAALGVQFHLSETLRGFVELVAINQSFRPQEGTFSYVSTQDGKTLSNDATSFVYKSGVAGVTTDAQGRNVVPVTNVAMNSVGVGAGLVYRF
ncbi:hypothetical protein GCM10023187_02060 [Nibrella viscosa]|uniref:Outer membrane protein beta-barrel domain-containing protein n=1 Tax=Nibrella viscosa TaxID=1084524 RepID=A0ABP8JS98_9BACT